MNFHDSATGSYEGDSKDIDKLKELLNKSTHLSCHQVNNVHICVCKELIAVCPQDTDPITGEVSGQTMVIPMPIFMSITNIVAEEMIKYVLSRTETKKDAKFN